MTLFNKDIIRAVLGRGLITTGILATALTLRAQQNTPSPAQGAQKHHDATSGQYSKGAGGIETCLQEAAKMNLATAKFAELASEKSQSAELKRFSQALAVDHQQDQAKVESLAKKHNIILPTSLDAKCQEELTKLQGLSGQEFDREFAKGAVEGHAMAVAHLNKAAMEAKDQDLAQYAKETLPKIKKHQQQAREVARAVGVDQATIASLEAKAKEGVGTSGTGTESSSGSSANKYPKEKDSPDSNKTPDRQTPRQP